MKTLLMSACLVCVFTACDKPSLPPAAQAPEAAVAAPTTSALQVDPNSPPVYMPTIREQKFELANPTQPIMRLERDYKLGELKLQVDPKLKAIEVDKEAKK